MNSNIQPDNATAMAGEDPSDFGAVDIVAAFTALRHDLKLQIRGGAETLDSLHRRLDRLESTLQNSAKPAEAADHQARSFALALAEIESALQRTIDGLRLLLSKAASQSNPLRIAEEKWQAVGWLTRWLAGKYHQQLMAALGDGVKDCSDNAKRDQLVLQSIELLIARVHRLMSQQNLKRQDVLGQPFDSALMNAIEAVESNDTPPGYVARQHKPAYFWKNALLSFAEVDVAKTP